MSIIQRLLGKKPNPTKDWPLTEAILPDFDLNDIRLGSLTFGDPLSGATCFGKPDELEWISKDYLRLIYSSMGLHLEFENDRLAYIAFLLESDQSSKLVNTIYSDGRRQIIERNFGEDQIISIFGEPSSIDKDEEEVILFYKDRMIMMEFEFSPEGDCLKRWNIFIKN